MKRSVLKKKRISQVRLLRVPIARALMQEVYGNISQSRTAQSMTGEVCAYESSVCQTRHLNLARSIDTEKFK